MNERIKELFQEAIDYADKTHTYTPEEGFNIQVWDKIRFEKFAELIVKECIERVREQYIPIRDQTVEGKLNPLHTQLRLRTEREVGIVECGVKSVTSLEELIQDQTDKWYKENISGVEE